MFGGLGLQLRRLMGAAGAVVRRAVRPVGERGAIRGLVLDLMRSRKDLLAENAFLRHQLVVAVRQPKHPKLRAAEGIVLVGLAALFASWRNALVLVQPETLLRWHRDLFRRFWARRSKPKSPPKPRLGHGRIDETMLYVHVAASRMRPLPPELRAVSCPDDPDQRIVHLLGLRSTVKWTDVSRPSAPEIRGTDVAQEQGSATA